LVPGEDAKAWMRWVARKLVFGREAARRLRDSTMDVLEESQEKRMLPMTTLQ
jgi:hypothetical protein